MTCKNILYIQPKEIKGTKYFRIFQRCFKYCDLLRYIMRNKHFENAPRIHFFYRIEPHSLIKYCSAYVMTPHLL